MATIALIPRSAPLEYLFIFLIMPNADKEQRLALCEDTLWTGLLRPVQRRDSLKKVTFGIRYSAITEPDITLDSDRSVVDAFLQGRAKGAYVKWTPKTRQAVDGQLSVQLSTYRVLQTTVWWTNLSV